MYLKYMFYCKLFLFIKSFKLFYKTFTNLIQNNLNGFYANY